MRAISAIISTLLVISLAACGSSGSDSGADVTGPGPDVVTGQDTPGPDDIATGVDTPAPSGLVLELFGQAPEQNTLPQQNLDIVFRLYDPTTGALIEGETVDVTLEVVTPPSTGTADATLSAASAVTDVDGLAEVTLSTGTATGVVYRVVGTTRGAADPATVRVTVGEVPTGTLDITFNYEGDNPPQDVEVLLLNQVYVCDSFNPGAPPASPVFRLDVPLADGGVVLPEVTQSEFWVVLLVGTDAAGSVVAGGCRADVRVDADDTTEITVAMGPVGLHLPGVYAITATFDLSNAGPSDAGDLASTLTTLLDDPQATLEAALKARITERIEDTATGDPTECVTTWEGAVGAAIATATPASAGWLGPFQAIQADLDAALGSVSIAGEMEVTSAEGPDTYEGELTWTSMALTFRSESLSWSVETMGSFVYPIRLPVDPDAMAMHVDGYDDLVVDSLEMTLEPGRIAGALVTQYIMDGAPGAPASLNDVSYDFFGCSDIWGALSAEATECLLRYQIPTRDFVEECEILVAAHMEPASTILLDWVVRADVASFTGTAKLYDDDQNLGTDRVEDGALSGNVTGDEVDLGTATGTFRADHL